MCVFLEEEAGCGGCVDVVASLVCERVCVCLSVCVFSSGGGGGRDGGWGLGEEEAGSCFPASVL